MSVIPLWLDQCMFDVLVDELRTHSTEWLESRRCEVISAQRELHTEELAIVRVLDERGRIDPTIGSNGESAQTVLRRSRRRGRWSRCRRSRRWR